MQFIIYWGPQRPGSGGTNHLAAALGSRHCDRTTTLACHIYETSPFSRYEKGKVSPYCCISGKTILVRILLRRVLTVTQITAVEVLQIYKLFKLLRPTPTLRNFFDGH